MIERERERERWRWRWRLSTRFDSIRWRWGGGGGGGVGWRDTHVVALENSVRRRGTTTHTHKDQTRAPETRPPERNYFPGSWTTMYYQKTWSSRDLSVAKPRRGFRPCTASANISANVGQIRLGKSGIRAVGVWIIVSISESSQGVPRGLSNSRVWARSGLQCTCELRTDSLRL